MCWHAHVHTYDSYSTPVSHSVWLCFSYSCCSGSVIPEHVIIPLQKSTIWNTHVLNHFTLLSMQRSCTLPCSLSTIHLYILKRIEEHLQMSMDYVDILDSSPLWPLWKNPNSTSLKKLCLIFSPLSHWFPFRCQIF